MIRTLQSQSKRVQLPGKWPRRPAMTWLSSRQESFFPSDSGPPVEGQNEELVMEVSANEHEAAVRQLDWPKELDARDVDHTVLSNAEGTLLPRNWPKRYDSINLGGNDESFVQSNLIECWSMSWWGFQKGKAAMILIVETHDDAAYKFHHPAGGPTVIGPRWRDQTGPVGISPQSAHELSVSRQLRRSRETVSPVCDRIRAICLAQGKDGSPAGRWPTDRNIPSSHPRSEEHPGRRRHLRHEEPGVQLRANDSR